MLEFNLVDEFLVDFGLAEFLNISYLMFVLQETLPSFAHHTTRGQCRQVHGGMAEYVYQRVGGYLACGSIL